MAHVLVVEDDRPTAEAIASELRAHGYSVDTAGTGADALALAQAATPDALTLDRLLPDTDGLALLAKLREVGIHAPVLMVSALGDVDQRIAGLRAGGDDYLIKPFAPSELAVRIEVLLRRTRPEAETVLQIGRVRIDRIRREAQVAGEPVRLLQMEFKLLEFLMRHAGATVSRRMLFEQVWNYHFDPGANLINVHIARLRRKLDMPGEPSAIVTVKGEGYRFDAV
ncbi:response regulator transcription factor [Sphingomonas sp. TDK1]|uniref:response regulator transcription factor n=1 Tax=Sphingomonas sp. TDK1 TaxID=453247 RepID=UPI0007D8D046|nr:response regulator transcription factor [Sphingomonas sp. TDK1]OAN62355.1 DNA-binding response regulator [Sphingomonas sp. TDK1]